MADILIEKLFDSTGDIKPIKCIECKNLDKIEDLLREKMDFLPEGQYFASLVDKKGDFQAYLNTIIISDNLLITKSDYDSDTISSIHSKVQR